MKHLVIAAFILLSSLEVVCSETPDGALARFLNGEKICGEELDKLTNVYGPAKEAAGANNDGAWYLNAIVLSVIDPAKNGGRPLHSSYVREEKSREKTYRELKAIYEKTKSPIVAYALVCPAMLLDDMEILPELFAKIAENKYLKAHFDNVYAKKWKPRLDPDF